MTNDLDVKVTHLSQQVEQTIVMEETPVPSGGVKRWGEKCNIKFYLTQIIVNSVMLSIANLLVQTKFISWR